jgi:hypothetical protein
MIENIRKYTVLIIFFLALVVVALVVGIKDDIFRSGASGQPVLKISGRTYTDKEFNLLGSGAFELASSLARAGDFGIYQFIMGLSSGAMGEDDAAEKFFTGRIILRQAKEEFGVHPGENEVSEYIRGLRAFAGPDGTFNEETYRNFIERGIGRLGMTENDLRELASDALASQKINAIVGAGLGVNREAVALDLAMENQRVSGSLARLDLDPYEEKIQPTEEELKTYWETLQDAFTTEPLRKFTYIIATPDMPEEPVEEEKPETLAEAAASDEEKAAAANKKAEEKAKRDADLAENRRNKQIQLDSQVDEFTFQLEEQKGAGFEDLAKENGWEVVTTALFPQATPPAELDGTLRASSRGGKAVDELFRIEITSDPVSRISQPIAIGENQWLVARLDGEEKSRPKTYDEAKDEARAQYIREKATEAMKTAAEEALAKIKEAVAAGKPFADAATEAGIEESRDFTRVTRDYRPDPSIEPRNLFDAIRYVDPGSFAEVLAEDDRVFLIHVATREVEKQEDAAARVEAQINSLATRNEIIAFMGWISDRIEAANVQRLYRR